MTYYFKSKKSSPIAFIGFDCPLYLLRKIKEGFIELEQLKENKKEFKSDLNKIVKKKNESTNQKTKKVQYKYWKILQRTRKPCQNIGWFFYNYI